MLQLAPRTMNTHLHALEGLTLLTTLDVDSKPKMMLATLVRLLLDRFLSADKTHSYSADRTTRAAAWADQLCTRHRSPAG